MRKQELRDKMRALVIAANYGITEVNDDGGNGYVRRLYNNIGKISVTIAQPLTLEEILTALSKVGVNKLPKTWSHSKSPEGQDRKTLVYLLNKLEKKSQSVYLRGYPLADIIAIISVIFLSIVAIILLISKIAKI